MKIFASILVSIIMALWVSAIAILAVQNAEPVSLKFVVFESVKIPFGVLLAFCAGAGMIGTSIVEVILRTTNTSNDFANDEPDFFADNEVD